MSRLVFFYWAGICVLVFAVAGLDKLLAKLQAWRVPERVLLGLSFLGGSFGLLLAMVLFHHKISKPAFRFGVPLMLALHMALAGYARYKGLW